MLAILTTHPIQYQIPVWQALARKKAIPFEVWYLSDHGTRLTDDDEFGHAFAWDIPTLEGYPHRFLDVRSPRSVHRFRGLRLQESLRSRIARQNVRAVFVNGWQVQAYWEAVWQARASNVAVWLRGESNDLKRTSPWKRPVRAFALKQLFHRVDSFLYIGEANRRLYLKHGVAPGRMHPMRYAVDNDRFRRQADALRAERLRLRAQWQIPANAFCILFAGKFIAKKRPLDVVRAASSLSSGGRPLHLLFAGSGELGPALRRACSVAFDNEASALPNDASIDRPRASFTGFLNQTEISKAYIAADCLILPSDARETWGLVVNEAMASGLPCVVSRACGCAEDLVAPIDPEWCFETGSVESLGRALRHVMSAPPDRRILEQHIAQFSIDNSADAAIRLYQATLS